MNPYIYGGYDHEFVEATEDFECPMCLLVVREPIQTECGHCFCRGCWQRHVAVSKYNNNPVVCPVDNSAVNVARVFLDRKMCRQIRDLKVYCTNRASGCPAIHELRYIQEHLETCRYQMVSCQNFCGEKVWRWHLKTHIRQDCMRRDVTCPTCSATMLAENLDIHNTFCPMKETACEFCQKGPFLRSQIERRDLRKHHKTHIHQHMYLLKCEAMGVATHDKVSRKMASHKMASRKKRGAEMVATSQSSIENHEVDIYELPVSLWDNVPTVGTRVTIPWSELPGFVYDDREMSKHRDGKQTVQESRLDTLNEFRWKFAVSLMVVFALLCYNFEYVFRQQGLINDVRMENERNAKKIEKLADEYVKLSMDMGSMVHRNTTMEGEMNGTLIEKLVTTNEKLSFDNLKIRKTVKGNSVDSRTNVTLLEKLIDENKKLSLENMEIRKHRRSNSLESKIKATTEKVIDENTIVTQRNTDTRTNMKVKSGQKDKQLVAEENTIASTENMEDLRVQGEKEHKNQKSKKNENNDTLLQKLADSNVILVGVCLYMIWCFGMGCCVMWQPTLIVVWIWLPIFGSLIWLGAVVISWIARNFDMKIQVGVYLCYGWCMYYDTLAIIYTNFMGHQRITFSRAQAEWIWRRIKNNNYYRNCLRIFILAALLTLCLMIWEGKMMGVALYGGWFVTCRIFIVKFFPRRLQDRWLRMFSNCPIQLCVAWWVFAMTGWRVEINYAILVGVCLYIGWIGSCWLLLMFKMPNAQLQNVLFILNLVSPVWFCVLWLFGSLTGWNLLPDWFNGMY